MPTSKPLVLEPLGLVTAPNKLGQYTDGAALVSLGVLHTAAGSHESAPLYEVFETIDAGGANEYLAAEVIQLPSGYTVILANRSVDGWAYCWLDPDDTVHAWSAAVHEYAPAGAVFEIDGRVSWTVTRDRLFVTTTTGPMVFDYLAPTTDAQRTPRLAGMFAPACSTAPDPGADAGALKDGNQAHTVMVVTRHFPDCYEITGPPSAAIQTVADGGDVNITNTVLQRTGHPQLLPGDTVEVYRTFQTPRPVNEGTPEEYNQGTSTTADYYMSSVFTVPDPASPTSHTWTEATGDLSLGEALYTNQGVVGASAQKRPPPIARVIEEYNGYTFYFDITEPPARVARAAGGMGDLTDTWSETWGIGDRSGTPDTVEINGVSFNLPGANALASTILCNVDDLARVNPDTPGEQTQPATGFAFRYDFAGFGDFTVRASHGGNYNPPLPTLAETAETVERPRRRNGVMWTENGQPEAVVAAGLVGKGVVYGAKSTSRSMVIFTDNGLWLWTGTGGSSSAGFDWGCVQVDTQVLLRGPKAYCRMGDLVFCASNNGAIVIDPSGQVREISTAALGDIGKNPLDANGKRTYNQADKTRVTANEETGDVYFSFNGDPYPYVFSARWNKWSRVRTAENGVDGAHGNLQCPIVFAEIDDDELVLRRASVDTYQQGIVRFQPTFDGDPATLKRWVEVEWYFHGDAVGAPIKFICNEMEGMERDLDAHDGAAETPSFIQPETDADVQSVGSEFSLAQTWMEVPKDAPAVSNSLSIGYVTPESTTKYVFYGCCITNNVNMNTTHRRKGA